MISTTENMSRPWLRSLHRTIDIVEATEHDAARAPDSAEWEWQGAVHWDLQYWAMSPAERILDDLLTSLGV